MLNRITKPTAFLTMWRLYGRGKIGEGERDGVGVALGFNTEKLRLATEGIQEKHGTYCIYLDRVRYGDDDPEVQRRVDDSPSIATLYAKSVIAMIQGAQEPPTDLTTEDADKFTILFPCAKHQDFEDERETRLVVCPALEVSLAGRAPLVGPDGRVVVKYLDALEEVLVGPSNKQDELFASVSATLKAKGFERVLVKKSETPFRFL